MFWIYAVGVLLGLMCGVPIGFWVGVRYIEKLIEREKLRKTAALMEMLDWRE